MIAKIILENNIICNRTDKKFQGKFNSFRVGNGNFKNSKLFEGLVIFEHNTQPHTQHIVSLLIFSCLSSCLSCCLSSFIFSLVFQLLSALSVCLSPCVVVCVREGLCVVRVGCVWCVCGVWCVCVYCVVLWHAEKISVCKFKTSPCVPAPRAHVLPHAGVVSVHTGKF